MVELFDLTNLKFEQWDEMLGVRGVTLTSNDDEVIGMVCVEDVFTTVLVVSENGYGKELYINDPEDNEPVYRITNRGGKGVKTLNITDKTGPLKSIKNVEDDNDLMMNYKIWGYH